MPKQPQVQGKVMQQQAVGRPVKDLPPLAVAALGEYLSRHPNMVELEQAARKIPKESLNAVLEPTDDPGNWLEEGLRLACTPEDMKAAGAGGHITEASLQKPYADMVPSTQNAMRSAVALVTPQAHGFAAIGKLDLSSGWAQLLLAGAQLQVAGWVAQPDLKPYIMHAMATAFGDKSIPGLQMLLSALLPSKAAMAFQVEVGLTREHDRHRRGLVVHPQEVGLVVPLIDGLPRARQAELTAEVLTGLLLPEGCLPPDTIWHWAAYQQLLQYGLLAPIVEAAAARKLDLAGAWQGAVRDLVTGHKEKEQRTVSQAKGALQGAVEALLDHSKERRKLSAANAQLFILEAQPQRTQDAAAAGGASSLNTGSSRSGPGGWQPQANGQPAATWSSREAPLGFGLGLQQQQVLLPAVKAFLRASAAEAERDGRRPQQQQQGQPPLHALLVLNGLNVGADMAYGLIDSMDGLVGPAVEEAPMGSSSSSPGSPGPMPPTEPVMEEGACGHHPAMCRAQRRLYQHAYSAGAAMTVAASDATSGQRRQLQQQEVLPLLLAVLSPCSPEQLLAAANVPEEERVLALHPPDLEEPCIVCDRLLSVGRHAQLDALVDAVMASVRLAEVIDLLGTSLLVHRLTEAQEVLAQQKAAPQQQQQHSHQQQQHQLGCMLRLCNEAQLLDHRCDLSHMYAGEFPQYFQRTLDDIYSGSGSSPPADSATATQGTAASTSSTRGSMSSAMQPTSTDSPHAASSSAGGHHVRFSSHRRCGAAGSRSCHSSAGGSPTAAATAAAAERPGPSLRVAAMRAAASAACEVQETPGLAPNPSSSSSNSEHASLGRRKRLVVVPTEESAAGSRGDRQGNGSTDPFSPRSDASFHTASDDDFVADDGERTPAAAAATASRAAGRGPLTPNRVQEERVVTVAKQQGLQQWVTSARDLCGRLLALEAAATALQHSLVHPEAASSSHGDSSSSSSRQEGQHSASPSTWGSLGSLGSMLGGSLGSLGSMLGAKGASSSTNSSSRPPEGAGPRLPKQRGQEQREAWEQQQQQWRTALWRRYGEVRPSGRLRFESYFPGAGPEVDKHQFWLLAAAVLRADLRHVAAHRLSEDLLSIGARLDVEDWPGTGSEKELAGIFATLEAPLQEHTHMPDRQMDAPLGGLDIQMVQLLRAAWRDAALQAGEHGPYGVARQAATSVLRLQLLLGQLGTRFTPATFPWAHLGRGMMRASVDSARLLERAREATASPGLLAAEDELRLLVRALAGLREFLNERSQRITRTTKVLVDAAKRASSSSGGGVEGQGPEYPASAYGRTQTGDYPAAMFTICQAWLLLQLRSRGLANSDLGSRLQAVGSAMDSLSWLVTYNTLHGPKPPAGNVDLLHSMHQQVSTALGELVSTWVPPYPLLNCGPKDGLFIPTCDTCNQKIDVRRAEAVPEHLRRQVEAGSVGPLVCEGCGVARWCSKACAYRSRHGRFCWEVLSRSLLYNTSCAAPETHLRALQQGRPRAVPLFCKGRDAVFGGAPEAEVMASSHRAPGALPNTVYLPTHQMCSCNPPRPECADSWRQAALNKWTLPPLRGHADEGASAWEAEAAAEQVEAMLQQAGGVDSWKPLGLNSMGRGLMNELD